MSVGGFLIEMRPMRLSESGRDVVRLWCMDRHGDEVCVKTTNPLFSRETGMWEAPGEMTWCESSHVDDDCGPSHWKPFGD